MPNNIYECPKVLLIVGQNAKIVIESDLCANVRIFVLMNVCFHYWSPFHANDCVFSRNEQQRCISYQKQDYVLQMLYHALFKIVSKVNPCVSLLMVTTG